MTPRVIAKAREIEPDPSHANWFENFPWTRLADVVMPGEAKPVVDITRVKMLAPAAVRDLLGDGSFGGAYQKDDSEMLELWRIGVGETRELLEESWPSQF